MNLYFAPASVRYFLNKSSWYPALIRYAAYNFSTKVFDNEEYDGNITEPRQRVLRELMDKSGGEPIILHRDLYGTPVFDPQSPDL